MAPLSRDPGLFLQTPKEVVLIWQEDHMVRHIFLTDKHSASVKPSCVRRIHRPLRERRHPGRRYDRIEHQDLCRPIRTPHTEKLHVVERFISSRTESDRGKRPCRGPWRVHHAVERLAALPSCRAGPDDRKYLLREQQRLFGNTTIRYRRRPSPDSERRSALATYPGPTDRRVAFALTAYPKPWAQQIAATCYTY